MSDLIEKALDNAEIYKLTGYRGHGVYMITIHTDDNFKHFAIRDPNLCDGWSYGEMIEEDMDDNTIQAWHHMHAPVRISWLELLVSTSVDRSHIRKYL